MKKRPLTITLLSLLYIATGCLGLAYHIRDFELIVVLVRVAGLAAGVFMLRGKNWARWLAIAWIATHVVIGAFHGPVQFGFHALLFILFAWVLFRPAANEFFTK